MYRTLLFFWISGIFLLGNTGEQNFNQVKNPDFEQGLSLGWKTDVNGSFSQAGVTDNAHTPSGKSCGFLIKKKGDHVAALMQDIAVKPGGKYLLSCTAKGKGILFGYIYDKGKKYLGSIVGIPIHTPEWTRYDKIITIPVKAHTIQLRFELYGTSTEGRGWIDTIFFGPQPPVPPEISNLKVVLDSERRVKLTWDRILMPGVSYQISRSRYPDMIPRKMDICSRTQDNTWLDKTLPRNWTKCYYQVNAINQYQGGSWGKKVMIKLPSPERRTDPAVWVTSPMEKIRRYQDLPSVFSAKKQNVKMSMAKNETEAIQILVGAREQEIKKLNAVFSGFQQNGKKVNALQPELFEVRYVMVNQPTIKQAQKTSGLYPDPLLPWRKPVDVPCDAIQGIWLQVKSSAVCPAGIYSGIVSLTANGKIFSQIKVELEVWDFTLPQTPSFKSAFAVWRNFIAQAYEVKPGSVEEQKLYEKYYWFMVERRMPPDDLPVSVTSPEAEQYLNDPRVNSFRIPCSWSKVNVEKMKKTAEYLRKKGWLSKGYVYCEDEPSPERYTHCKNLADQVHQAGKDIPFLLAMTVPPPKTLFGGVDIWVQKLDCFDHPICKKRKEAGDRLWWYTCVSPQEPYPTYLIDDLGISNRILSWLQVKYRVEGVLYWCVNVCSEYRNGEYQPEVSVWEKAEMFPYANGDGFLIYPGKQVGIDGPVSSIRLELIRDGNEDVEYFHLLRCLMMKNGVDNIEEKIALLILPVAENLTLWTKSSDKLMEQRNLLAKQILKQKGMSGKR